MGSSFSHDVDPLTLLPFLQILAAKSRALFANRRILSDPPSDHI